MKNIEQDEIESFLLKFFFLLTFVNPATCFYVNLMVSKTFRQKTRELLCMRWQHRLNHNSQSQNPVESVAVKRLPIK